MSSLIDQSTIEITNTGIVTGTDAVHAKLTHLLSTPVGQLPFGKRDDGLDIDQFLLMPFSGIAANGILIEVTNAIRALEPGLVETSTVIVNKDFANKRYNLLIQIDTGNLSEPLTIERVYTSHV